MLELIRVPLIISESALCENIQIAVESLVGTEIWREKV